MNPPGSNTSPCAQPVTALLSFGPPSMVGLSVLNTGPQHSIHAAPTRSNAPSELGVWSIMTVTRLEIAEHVAPAFDHPPTSRAELLAEAVRTQARTAVIEVLERLPDQTYSQLRALWLHLGEVPIDA